MQLLNFLRILSVILIMISLFSSSILQHFDIVDQEHIEFSEMPYETETERETEKEKEIEETEVDEFINGYTNSVDLNPNKLLGFGIHAYYLVISHGEVITPPPELV